MRISFRRADAAAFIPATAADNPSALILSRYNTKHIVRAMNRQAGSVDVWMVDHVREQVLSQFQFVFGPFNTAPFHSEEGRGVKVLLIISSTTRYYCFMHK